MNNKLKAYFRNRQLQIEREQSRRVGEVAFLIGAAVAAKKEDDDTRILRGGIVGLLCAAVFEVVCPKTSNVIKRIL